VAAWDPVVRAVFATAVCAFAIGCFAGDVLLHDFFGPLIVLPLALLSFPLVGSLLVVRRAGGPIGWSLAIAGALFQPLLLSGAYAYALFEDRTGLPGAAEFAVWLGTVIWIPSIGLLVIAMVLFPDGRPPGRAFAILMWSFVALIVVGTAAYAVADMPIVMPRPFADPGAPSRSIRNPFAVQGAVGDLMAVAAAAFNRMLLAMIIAPAALVVRFVRSRGVARQQLKWLMYTAAVGFGLLVFAFVAPRGIVADHAWAASVIAMGLLPVAIGIAIVARDALVVRASEALARRCDVLGAGNWRQHFQIRKPTGFVFPGIQHRAFSNEEKDDAEIVLHQTGALDHGNQVLSQTHLAGVENYKFLAYLESLPEIVHSRQIAKGVPINIVVHHLYPTERHMLLID